MPGCGTRNFYERLLGLKEPWKAKAVKMDVEGRRVEVEVECAERTIWASPKGRQRLHIHGWERRSWRHLSVFILSGAMASGKDLPRGNNLVFERSVWRRETNYFGRASDGATGDLCRHRFA